MNYFTHDNTDGLNVRELDELNRTLEAALDNEPLTDADDAIRDSHVKNLAEKVLHNFHWKRMDWGRTEFFYH